MTKKMKTYECTKCGTRQTCLGKVVGHECPKNQSKPWRIWREVKAK